MGLYRAQFRMPDRVISTLTSVHSDETLSQMLERWQNGTCKGGALIHAQVVPEDTAPDRIRFCPFCGNRFGPTDTGIGRPSADCDECENTVDVRLY